MGITAYLLGEIGLGVNSAGFGQGRVEVEGCPGYGEAVIGGVGDIRGTVEGDGAFETGFAYVALEGRGVSVREWGGDEW